MKYNVTFLSNSEALIEITPQNDKELFLFKNMDRLNIDEDTLYHYYSEGLKTEKINAVLLSIKKFLNFPTKAIINYDVIIGLGN